MNTADGLLGLSLILDLGAGGTLLALLLCGHALGDFVFQTETMVCRKSETRWLLYHVLEVTALHAVLLLPVLSLPVVVVLLGIGVCHFFIDRLKVLVDGRGSRSMTLFVLDQLLHLLTLLVAWRLLLAWREADQLLLPFFAPYQTPLTVAAVGLTAYAFNWNGGGTVVALLLNSYSLPATLPDDEARHALRLGWKVGILERTIFLTLVLLQQWSALALLYLAKSVLYTQDARRRRGIHDFYLVGSLASLLIAVVTGLLTLVLV